MAIQPETVAGRKEYFRRKRDVYASTWWTGPDGNVHIPLRDGYEALISGDKKHLASQFLWRLKKHSVRRGVSRGKCKLYVEAAVVEELRNRYGKYTSLHRVVADAPSGAEVDHRDGNGLNCVDGNLRIATRNQNAVNRKYDNPSGYRGVRRNPWGSFVVQITYDGKNHHLGSFSSAEEAGLAYNAEESRVFGEFAILNDIPEDVCQL